MNIFEYKNGYSEDSDNISVWIHFKSNFDLGFNVWGSIEEVELGFFENRKWTTNRERVKDANLYCLCKYKAPVEAVIDYLIENIPSKTTEKIKEWLTHEQSTK